MGKVGAQRDRQRLPRRLRNSAEHRRTAVPHSLDSRPNPNDVVEDDTHGGRRSGEHRPGGGVRPDEVCVRSGSRRERKRGQRDRGKNAFQTGSHSRCWW